MADDGEMQLHSQCTRKESNTGRATCRLQCFGTEVGSHPETTVVDRVWTPERPESRARTKIALLGWNAGAVSTIRQATSQFRVRPSAKIKQTGRLTAEKMSSYAATPKRLFDRS